MTPSETDRIIQGQAEEIERLKRKVAGYEDMDSELKEVKAQLKGLLKEVRDIKKSR